MIDPLSEDYESTTPYAYVENNPIGFIDPTGMYKVDANGNISITDRNEIEMFLNYQKASPNSGYQNAYQHITNADNGFKLELDEVVVTRSGKGIEQAQAQQSAMSRAISIGLLTGSISSPLDGPLPVAESVGFGLGVLTAYSAIKSAEMGIAVPSTATMAYGVPSMSEANEAFFNMMNSGKTADELLPGSLKRSPSYNPKYGNKTRSELEALARKGDQVAKKMKKLVDQVPRLLDKNKNK